MSFSWYHIIMKNKLEEIIFIVEEDSEGGYIARALNVPIFTEGETIDEIKNNIIDAIKCHFDKKNLPKIIRLHFVKDEVLTI